MDDGWNVAGDKLAADIEKDNPPTTAEILKAARDLIADPEHWRTGTLCDSTGRVCALGAIGVVLWGEDFVREGDKDPYELLAKEPAVAVLDAAMGHTEGDDIASCIVEFNDEADTAEHHAKVLAMFDCAIAKASA